MATFVKQFVKDYYGRKHHSLVAYLGGQAKIIEGVQILPWQFPKLLQTEINQPSPGTGSAEIDAGVIGSRRINS